LSNGVTARWSQRHSPDGADRAYPVPPHAGGSYLCRGAGARTRRRAERERTKRTRQLRSRRSRVCLPGRRYDLTIVAPAGRAGSRGQPVANSLSRTTSASRPHRSSIRSRCVAASVRSRPRSSRRAAPDRLETDVGAAARWDLHAPGR
jgi:hypothetical protein